MHGHFDVATGSAVVATSKPAAVHFNLDVARRAAEQHDQLTGERRRSGCGTGAQHRDTTRVGVHKHVWLRVGEASWFRHPDEHLIQADLTVVGVDEQVIRGHRSDLDCPRSASQEAVTTLMRHSHWRGTKNNPHVRCTATGHDEVVQEDAARASHSHVQVTFNAYSCHHADDVTVLRAHSGVVAREHVGDDDIGRSVTNEGDVTQGLLHQRE